MLVPQDRPIPADLAVDREPFTDDALDVALAEPADDGSDPRPTGADDWSITDNGSAEWAMRKVAAIAREQDQLTEQAADWTDRIQAWFEQANGRLAVRRSWLEAKLIDYQRRIREADPKSKTLFLPSGKVASSGHQARVKVVNDGVYVGWAQKAAPDTLETVYKVVASKVKARFSVALLPALFEVTLECGHETAMPYSAQPSIGEIVECVECADSGAPGPVHRAIAGVEPSEHVWSVVDDQGDSVIIPGLVAEPPEVTYRVNPG
jgi:hypothetical protein